MRPDDSFVQQPIRSLQTMLRVLSKDNTKYPPVIPDGIYGPGTMFAVSAFQRINALPVTGITDRITWEAITGAYLQAQIRAEQPEGISLPIAAGKIYEAGDAGPYISLLQSMLLTLSNMHASIEEPSLNGVLDPVTQASLSSFQKLSGLPVTGTADKITIKHLVLQFTLAASRAEQKSGFLLDNKK